MIITWLVLISLGKLGTRLQCQWHRMVLDLLKLLTHIMPVTVSVLKGLTALKIVRFQAMTNVWRFTDASKLTA